MERRCKQSVTHKVVETKRVRLPRTRFPPACRSLVVVIGVLGGGIVFGLPGLLLAVPTITILKAFVSSASNQLKAYGVV